MTHAGTGRPFPHSTDNHVDGTADTVLQAADIHGSVHFHQNHFAPPPVPRQLPVDAAHFTGRAPRPPELGTPHRPGACVPLTPPRGPPPAPGGLRPLHRPVLRPHRAGRPAPPRRLRPHHRSRGRRQDGA